MALDLLRLLLGVLLIVLGLLLRLLRLRLRDRPRAGLMHGLLAFLRGVLAGETRPRLRDRLRSSQWRCDGAHARGESSHRGEGVPDLAVDVRCVIRCGVAVARRAVLVHYFASSVVFFSVPYFGGMIPISAWASVTS